MKKLVLAVAIVSLGAVALIATAVAKNGGGDNGNGRSFSAKLTGYEEIIPANPTAATPTGEGGAVSTVGEGRFRARLTDNGTKIEFRLRYEDLEGTTTGAAHIHFGQRSTIGNVVAFLCGGGGKPACPADSADITGTIVAADVTGLAAAQGIAAGEFSELIRAMRNGATYVNVHTNTWPSGEIRGQINGRHHFDFGHRGKGKNGD